MFQRCEWLNQRIKHIWRKVFTTLSMSYFGIISSSIICWLILLSPASSKSWNDFHVCNLFSFKELYKDFWHTFTDWKSFIFTEGYKYNISTELEYTVLVLGEVKLIFIQSFLCSLSLLSKSYVGMDLNWQFISFHLDSCGPAH